MDVVNGHVVRKKHCECLLSSHIKWCRLEIGDRRLRLIVGVAARRQLELVRQLPIPDLNASLAGYTQRSV